MAELMMILVILFLISWLFVFLAVYLLPCIIAYMRKHNNIVAILVLNLVLGWTFLGWLAALLWSLNSDVQGSED